MEACCESIYPVACAVVPLLCITQAAVKGWAVQSSKTMEGAGRGGGAVPAVSEVAYELLCRQQQQRQHGFKIMPGTSAEWQSERLRQLFLWITGNHGNLSRKGCSALRK